MVVCWHVLRESPGIAVKGAVQDERVAGRNGQVGGIGREYGEIQGVGDVAGSSRHGECLLVNAAFVIGYAIPVVGSAGCKDLGRRRTVVSWEYGQPQHEPGGAAVGENAVSINVSAWRCVLFGGDEEPIAFIVLVLADYILHLLR